MAKGGFQTRVDLLAVICLLSFVVLTISQPHIGSICQQGLHLVQIDTPFTYSLLSNLSSLKIVLRLLLVLNRFNKVTSTEKVCSHKVALTRQFYSRLEGYSLS